jgi:hypothetical protein
VFHKKWMEIEKNESSCFFVWFNESNETEEFLTQSKEGHAENTMDYLEIAKPLRPPKRYTCKLTFAALCVKKENLAIGK